MIHTLPHEAVTVIPEEQLEILLSHDSVQSYLAALDEHAPGMDLRIDYAIAMGFRVIHAAEAGRLDRYRELAARTFDTDEHDTLIAAALAWLLPLVLAGARAEEAETGAEAVPGTSAA